MLVFVKLLITLSISMYIMCVMFVQRFELHGRYITNFHYYYYYDAKERVQKPSFPTVIVQPIHCYQS